MIGLRGFAASAVIRLPLRHRSARNFRTVDRARTPEAGTAPVPETIRRLARPEAGARVRRAIADAPSRSRLGARADNNPILAVTASGLENFFRLATPRRFFRGLFAAFVPLLFLDPLAHRLGRSE